MSFSLSFTNRYVLYIVSGFIFPSSFSILLHRFQDSDSKTLVHALGDDSSHFFRVVWFWMLSFLRRNLSTFVSIGVFLRLNGLNSEIIKPDCTSARNKAGDLVSSFPVYSDSFQNSDSKNLVLMLSDDSSHFFHLAWFWKEEGGTFQLLYRNPIATNLWKNRLSPYCHYKYSSTQPTIPLIALTKG